jgi:hypothetical protein
MATPLTADHFLAALKAEGLHVVERAGWRTHNREGHGGWGPMNGVVIHHTAGTESKGIVWNGVTGLPGPLCHTHLGKDGVATMIANGRANHAGTFAQNAHNAVVNESSTHPYPDAAEPVDGNAHYYGIEIENLGNGHDPYPAVQYEAAVRWAAALCRAHGWSEESVIGHKEGTRRKIDPSFDMKLFRKNVAERLAHSADWTSGEEDGMPTATEIADAVLTRDGKISIPGASASNPTYTLASTQTEILKRIDKANAAIAAQQAAITELVKTVVSLASNVTAIDPDALVARITGAIESVTVHLDVPDN